MRRVLSPLGPLVLGGLVLLAFVPSARSADLPLDKLTEAAVRQRVAAALAADMGPETAALKDLVAVDPAGISYRPGSLTWRYQPKAGKPLIPEQRQGVENALRAILTRALGQAPGMDNLRPEDLASLLKSTTFTSAAPPPAGKPPVAKPPEVGVPSTPPAPPVTPAPPTPPAAPAVSAEDIAKVKAALQKAEADRAEQARKVAALVEQLKKLEQLDEQAKKLAEIQEALKKLAEDVKNTRDAGRKVGDDIKAVQDSVKKVASQLDEEVRNRQAEAKQMEDARRKLAEQAASDRKQAEQTRAELKQLADQAAEVRRAGEQLAEQVKAGMTKVAADNDKLRTSLGEQFDKVNKRIDEEAKQLNRKIDEALKKANDRFEAELAQMNRRLSAEEQTRALQAYRLDRRLNRLLEVLPLAQPAAPSQPPADPCAPAPRSPASARPTAPSTPPTPPASPALRRPLSGQGLRSLLQAPGTVTVRLPAEARLYADNQPIPLTSSSRTFQTPPLEYGDIHKYTLRAEVGYGGDRRTLTRTVAVEADKTTTVDLYDVLRQPTPGGRSGAAVDSTPTLTWTLVLEGLADPARRDQVIMALQTLTGLNAKDAAALMDQAPRPVRSYRDRAEAGAALRKLRDAGARVGLKD